MVNSNPETVSTDYDTSDRLYFEPLTFEDVLNVIEAEKPEGVIVQFGGQTPLKLAIPLLHWLQSPAGQATGTRIWGTSPESIDTAEDALLIWERTRLPATELFGCTAGMPFSLKTCAPNFAFVDGDNPSTLTRGKHAFTAANLLNPLITSFRKVAAD